MSSRGKYKFYDSSIENIETFGNNDCQIMECCCVLQGCQVV